jgi:hypothetical protein
MTLHKKPYIENKKEAAARKLALRLEALKAQGVDERTIQKDTAVRQIKAAIRQARRQMDRIAEFEDLAQRKAEAREQKRNAPKEIRHKAKKGAQGESHRKAKREKKQSLQGQGDSKE